MAQVAQDTPFRARVEHYLDFLLREWRSVPAIAQEWGEWEDHEQLDFVVEWPLREDQLRQLDAWAEQCLLTPAQRARYEDLLALVAAHRPTLDRLLQE